MHAYPNSTEKTSDWDQQLNTVDPGRWKVLEGHQVLWKRAGTVKYGGKLSASIELIKESPRLGNWVSVRIWYLEHFRTKNQWLPICTLVRWKLDLLLNANVQRYLLFFFKGNEEARSRRTAMTYFFFFFISLDFGIPEVLSIFPWGCVGKFWIPQLNQSHWIFVRYKACRVVRQQ